MVESNTAALLKSKFNITLIKEDKLIGLLGSRQPTEANLLKVIYSSPIEEVSF